MSAPNHPSTDDRLACADCPLRRVAHLREQSGDELELIQRLRGPQRFYPAGAHLVEEGAVKAPLFTLFSGWAFRFRTLSDGRRQIVDVLMPGDFAGLQQRMVDGAVHGIEALSDVWICPFQRDAAWQLHQHSPQLGYAVTWISAESAVNGEEMLLSLGRRTADERAAAFLLSLYRRARALYPPGQQPEAVPFPLLQQHMADALGLSLVHMNRVLRRLEQRGLHQIRQGTLRILNPRAMERLADLWNDGQPAERPLI